MSVPTLAQTDAALDELAEMYVRAATVAALPDADLSEAGALQANRVADLLAMLDPATETGFVGGLVGKAGAIGSRALAKISNGIRTMTVSRLAVLTGGTAAYLVASQYWGAVAQAELETAANEDRVMAEILASLPPEKRAEAFARMSAARKPSDSPSWLLPAVGVALAGLLLWRVAR